MSRYERWVARRGRSRSSAAVRDDRADGADVHGVERAAELGALLLQGAELGAREHDVPNLTQHSSCSRRVGQREVGVRELEEEQRGPRDGGSAPRAGAGGQRDLRPSPLDVAVAGGGSGRDGVDHERLHVVSSDALVTTAIASSESARAASHWPRSMATTARSASAAAPVGVMPRDRESSALIASTESAASGRCRSIAQPARRAAGPRKVLWKLSSAIACSASALHAIGAAPAQARFHHRDPGLERAPIGREAATISEAGRVGEEAGRGVRTVQRGGHGTQHGHLRVALDEPSFVEPRRPAWRCPPVRTSA